MLPGSTPRAHARAVAATRPRRTGRTELALTALFVVLAAALASLGSWN